MIPFELRSKTKKTTLILAMAVVSVHTAFVVAVMLLVRKDLLTPGSLGEGQQLWGSFIVIDFPISILAILIEVCVGPLAKGHSAVLQDAYYPAFIFGVLGGTQYFCLILLVGKIRSKRFAKAKTPTCRICGYDLRGLDKPRCPECGTPFDPKLLEHQPHASQENMDK